MAETKLKSTATGVASSTTDWSRVAELRRETERAIVRTEEAAKRLDEALKQVPSK
jgi:hypothetical protein